MQSRLVKDGSMDWKMLKSSEIKLAFNCIGQWDFSWGNLQQQTLWQRDPSTLYTEGL